jgi:hypothetical protein
MLAHGWMSIVTWIFGCDALNCATSAWYDGPSAPVKPVQIFSWTVGPAGADDDAAAVDDDAAELAVGDPDAAEVAPELVAPPDGVAAFFEFELHPESATAPTTSAAIVVTSGFMRWTSMPETPVGGRLLRPPEGD